MNTQKMNWVVKRAVDDAVYRAVVDSSHPALQDFLREAL